MKIILSLHLVSVNLFIWKIHIHLQNSCVYLKDHKLNITLLQMPKPFISLKFLSV